MGPLGGSSATCLVTSIIPATNLVEIWLPSIGSELSLALPEQGLMRLDLPSTHRERTRAHLPTSAALGHEANKSTARVLLPTWRHISDKCSVKLWTDACQRFFMMP